MFDFERLELYQIVKEQTIKLLEFLPSDSLLDPSLKDQWKSTNFSVYLNLIEGTGRIAENDKRHFLTLARGNVYQCVAILNLVREMNQIDESTYTEMYNRYESISKMLLGMYRSYNKPKT